MVGRLRGVARILAVEAVAAVPTVAVLGLGAGAVPAVLVGAACLAVGYALLRMGGSDAILEGAWLGVAVGGGIGLAQAEAAVLAAAEALAWVRPWLLSIVACAGIGIALGFLARYDQHHRAVRALRGGPRGSRGRARSRLQG